MNAMPEFGGMASVLGLKLMCVLLWGGGTAMCNWIRTPIVERKENRLRNKSRARMLKKLS